MSASNRDRFSANSSETVSCRTTPAEEIAGQIHLAVEAKAAFNPTTFGLLATIFGFVVIYYLAVLRYSRALRSSPRR